MYHKVRYAYFGFHLYFNQERGAIVKSLSDLTKSHRLAHGEDIPRIFELLQGGNLLDSVLVRDLNSVDQGVYPLTDVARRPFTTEFVFGYHVLHGIDLTTGGRRSLRITEGGVVELSVEGNSDWFPPSMGSVRLYIPRA
jgi:hypothetical protein